MDSQPYPARSAHGSSSSSPSTEPRGECCRTTRLRPRLPGSRRPAPGAAGVGASDWFERELGGVSVVRPVRREPLIARVGSHDLKVGPPLTPHAKRSLIWPCGSRAIAGRSLLLSAPRICQRGRSRAPVVWVYSGCRIVTEKTASRVPRRSSALCPYGILTRKDSACYDLVARTNCEIEFCGPRTASAKEYRVPSVSRSRASRSPTAGGDDRGPGAVATETNGTAGAAMRPAGYLERYLTNCEQVTARARAHVGESARRSPSDETRSRLYNLTLTPRCERAVRASHAIGARRRSGERERV